jgi:hypothetical protein
MGCDRRARRINWRGRYRMRLGEERSRGALLTFSSLRGVGTDLPFFSQLEQSTKRGADDPKPTTRGHPQPTPRPVLQPNRSPIIPHARELVIPRLSTLGEALISPSRAHVGQVSILPLVGTPPHPKRSRLSRRFNPSPRALPRRLRLGRPLPSFLLGQTHSFGCCFRGGGEGALVSFDA